MGDSRVSLKASVAQTSLRWLLPSVWGSALGIPHLEAGTQQLGILQVWPWLIPITQSVAGYQCAAKEIPAPQATLCQCLLSSCHPLYEVWGGRMVLSEPPSPLSKLEFLTQLLQSWWLRALGLVPQWHEQKFNGRSKP